jgi:glycosyltransferase involved in cell wall biosynthesis
MSRIGTNPARKKIMQYIPARVTAAIMVYIPEQKGYFEQRLEIFKLCIHSLRANTKTPFDLLVLANGCCKEVLNALREMQENSEIGTLIISKENLGVIGGYKMIFNAAQGEIVAYCDDDIVFYPNWLEEQLKILETFPNVGMVSGVPVRGGARHANTAIANFLQVHPSDISVKEERRIPNEWEIDWCISTGRDADTYLKETSEMKELVISKNHVEAIASANHFQFIAPKLVIQKALPENWSLNLMDSLVPLEEAVDNLGYLRLSTVGRYCRHVGNTMTEALVKEFDSLPISVQPSQKKKSKKHWLLRIPGMGRVFWKIYDWLFKVLNQVD